jgi:long-chain acyl-CoA synthetase
MTWRTGRIRAIAAGLLSLGLDREDRVGILCNTRVEWLLADLGVLSAGGATTTVYPSSTAEECAYILADSAARYAFVEDDKQLAKLAAHRAELPRLTKLVLVDGAPGEAHKDWVITLAELEASGAAHLARDPRAIDDIVAGIKGEHLATLIYTSGTTGKPKGVRLLHECWAYCADAIDATRLWIADDVQYLWLPMSHSFGKVLMVGHIASGSVTAVDGRIPKLVENLAVVKPTLMSAVPRIFEKVYNKIIEGEGRWCGQEPDLPVGDRRRPRRLADPPARRHARRPARAPAAARRAPGVLEGQGDVRRPREVSDLGIGAAVARDRRVLPRLRPAHPRGLRPDRDLRGRVRQPTQPLRVRHRRPAAAGHRVQARARGGVLIKSPGVMKATTTSRTRPPGADRRRLAEHRRSARSTRRHLRITDRKKDLIKTSGGSTSHRKRSRASSRRPVRISARYPRRQAQLRHLPSRADEETTMKWAASTA